MVDNIFNIRNEILSLVNDYSDINFKQKEFAPGISEVPVSGKVIGSLELKNMVEASLDGWLTTGRFNEQFEKKLASFLGIKCLLTVNSGSSANLIAFSTLTSPKLKERAIQKGDEVISVAAGFPTTVNPIIQFGAVPVFIDVKIPTYDKYNLWLIEDSCDALGSKFNGQNVGTFGDLATLSFYPAHHITMGEGGAVFTNSKKLERIAESFRDWGRDCYCEPGKDNTCNKRFGWQLGDLPFGYDHKYTYSHLGYNMKITDMQAACGLAQLDRLEGFIKKRKENFDFLYKNLKELEEFLILPEPEKSSEPSWFGFPLSLRQNKKFNRVDLISYLNANKIGTRLLFAGNLIKQPYMKDVNFKIYQKLLNTDFAMENTFWIGLYPGLSKKHLEYVLEKFKNYFSKK